MERAGLMKRIVIIGIFWLLLSVAWVPSLMAQTALTSGVFLVATDKIAEGIFEKSVVLVVRHDDAGTVGVMINKPSQMELSRVLPGHGLRESDSKFYLGGPVQPMMVSALNLTGRPHPTMTPLFDDVYWVPGMRALAHIIQQIRGPERIRGYMGLSNWGAGQLAVEIKSGAWLVVPADREMLLSDQPEGVWSKLIARWSGRWI